MFLKIKIFFKKNVGFGNTGTSGFGNTSKLFTYQRKIFQLDYHDYSECFLPLKTYNIIPKVPEASVPALEPPPPQVRCTVSLCWTKVIVYQFIHFNFLGGFGATSAGSGFGNTSGGTITRWDLILAFKQLKLTSLFWITYLPASHACVTCLLGLFDMWKIYYRLRLKHWWFWR